MSDYHRNRVPGGTFFFTVNLLDRRSDLLVTQINILRDAVCLAHAFTHHAWVVLHENMRCLWTLLQGMPTSPVANAGRTEFV